MITCKACGYQAHDLKPHFIGGRKATCTMALDEYQKEYPDEALVSEAFKAKLAELKSKKKLNTLTPKKYSISKTFGLAMGKDSFVTGFVERTSAVPEIDPEYKFHPEATKIVLLGLQTNRPTMVHGPTGCHAKGTIILMADGSLKAVENIVVGDEVMGPDGKSRNVIRLYNGYDDLYEINPKKEHLGSLILIMY